MCDQQEVVVVAVPAVELQPVAEGAGLATIEEGNTDVDDDGLPRRTGTVWTASAHIITAVIGSGVLSLAWAIAQLGWVAGILALTGFSVITLYTSTLLADCYRCPETGKRSYTYMDAVRNNLGGIKVIICGCTQYANLIGTSIGYTIATAISMKAVKRSHCFHKNGHDVDCQSSSNLFMIYFGVMEIFISQIPNFHKIWWLSYVAAGMSFSYSFIGLGLSIAKTIGGEPSRTSLTGVEIGIDVTADEKIWGCFRALGNMAFAYSYAMVLIEIQDTLRSDPPENKVMKKATKFGVASTSIFYLSCGCVGYRAFGNNAPGNFLTGFGFYEPFWLIDIANICIIIHLVGAYQVFTQPVFSFIEKSAAKRWPLHSFINKEISAYIPGCGQYCTNRFRLLFRTIYVIITTVVAMIVPFFNDVLALLGAIAFWPLTVYFPTEMYMARNKVPAFSRRWLCFQVLSAGCLVVSVVAAAGSIQGIITDLKMYKPFHSSGYE
ncbi:Amino acid permease 6 [Nymphaea thermarum]|nr:Amino acid permease 6 [Nymphaea thermarum]